MIGLTGTLQTLSVTTKGLGEAGYVISLCFDLLGVTKPDAHLVESFEIGTDGVGVGTGRSGRYRLQPSTLLPLLDEANTWLGHAKDLPTEGVNGAHVEPTPTREPFDHFGCGSPVVSEGGEDFRLDAPVLDEMTDPGSEHPGLPRAGRGDDPGWADMVGHRLVLVGGQIDRGLDEGRNGGISAQVHRLVMNHHLIEIEGLTRTTVDPRWSPIIGSDDIGRATDSDIEPGGRLVTPPPHRRIGAGVVGVVPDHFGETFPEKGESAAQLVGRGVGCLDPTQLVGCDIELVDSGETLHVPTLRIVHRREQAVWVGEQSHVDSDPVGVRPGQRGRRIGTHHHRPSQKGWARCRHPIEITSGRGQIRQVAGSNSELEPGRFIQGAEVTRHDPLCRHRVQIVADHQ